MALSQLVVGQCFLEHFVRVGALFGFESGGNAQEPWQYDEPLLVVFLGKIDGVVFGQLVIAVIPEERGGFDNGGGVDGKAFCTDEAFNIVRPVGVLDSTRKHKWETLPQHLLLETQRLFAVLWRPLMRQKLRCRWRLPSSNFRSLRFRRTASRCCGNQIG